MMHDLFGNQRNMVGNQRHPVITIKANDGALMGFNIGAGKPEEMDPRLHAQRQTPDKKSGGTHRASGPGGGDGSTSKDEKKFWLLLWGRLTLS